MKYAQTHHSAVNYLNKYMGNILMLYNLLPQDA